MSEFEYPIDVPEGRPARVRLFPLPDLVMFPHVLQPLLVFEPRYCCLLADALRDDSLIAMALLQSGQTGDPSGRPPIAETACVGRVMSHVQENEERHKILLLGLRRAEILQELDEDRPYRVAEVRLLRDVVPSPSAVHAQQLRQTLMKRFREYLPPQATAGKQLEVLLSGDVPLGMLTDIVAFTVRLDQQAKLQLLRELHVERRAEMLLEGLERMLAGRGRPPGKYPPDFSLN